MNVAVMQHYDSLLQVSLCTKSGLGKFIISLLSRSVSFSLCCADEPTNYATVLHADTVQCHVHVDEHIDYLTLKLAKE